MTNIGAIREALKVRLDTIPGLTTYATMPGSVNVPAAVVIPGPGPFLNYHESFEGADRVAMSIVVYVAYTHQDGSQGNLDGYLANTGTSSVKAAIDGDLDLDGTVQFAVVTEARNYGILNVGGTDYLSCEFGVDIGAL